MVVKWDWSNAIVMVKRDGGQTGWWSNRIGWEAVSMQHIGQTENGQTGYFDHY